jgi:hypothetical protein
MYLIQVVKTGPIEPENELASGLVSAENRSAREPRSNRDKTEKTSDPVGSAGLEV